MLKLLIITSLLFVSPSARAENVLIQIRSLLAQAIHTETDKNNVNNVKFFKKTEKMLESAQFLWGVDEGCHSTPGQITLAHVPRVDAQKDLRLVYVCPIALSGLNLNQLSHALIHELAHLQGVKNESQANFVANRVFSDCGLANPFLYKDFKDAIDFQSKIEPGKEDVLKQIFSSQENIEYAQEQMKKLHLWSEKDQAWLVGSYADLAKSEAASSNHVFFDIGAIVLNKNRVLNNN